MTGYAAFGRVERGRVSPPDRPAAVAAPPIDDDGRVVELPAAGLCARESRIPAVLTAAREQWAIITFYLFDANSWR